MNEDLYFFAKARQRDLLAEAEARRALRLYRQGTPGGDRRTGTPRQSLNSRLMRWLGERLIALGEGLSNMASGSRLDVTTHRVQQ